MIVEHWENSILIGTYDDGVTPEPPTVDPLHQLAQAIVEATSLEDIKPVAQQILDDGIS
jgi:hypothetical protein